MTVRKTSAVTYQEIKSNGLLSESRMKVYEMIYKYGPLTGAQVSVLMKNHKSSVSETVRNRITELVKHGVVDELGETVCPITKRLVILFDVNTNLPAELPKIKTKKQKISSVVKELKAWMVKHQIPKSSHEDLKLIVEQMRGI